MTLWNDFRDESKSIQLYIFIRSKLEILTYSIFAFEMLLTEFFIMDSISSMY